MAPARRAHFWGWRRSRARLSTNYSRYGSAVQPAASRPRLFPLGPWNSFSSTGSASRFRPFSVPVSRPNLAVLYWLAFRRGARRGAARNKVRKTSSSKWLSCVDVAKSDFTRMASLSDQIAPYYAGWQFGPRSHVPSRSRHTMRVGIPMDLSLLYQNRAILCGLEFRRS